ncbi:MFS transporter [Croceicoccus gelatinilyticus]|uniref:MFS transporter n=1 Tax=Croceicoccus gelatinilyticus TaxID=2835536 RepID=UPI001BCC1B21|nr:MFS transporter [Croceicoccus gelatinilyticus]MBS7668792.1 MFS transporter [Croceicoccus gelatinilyticus]
MSVRDQADDTATLSIIAIATGLVLAVFTLPLTTLASTSAAIGAGIGGEAWILSAMPLGCAVGLLPGGALADAHGRKRVFNAGLAVMGAALVASMIANSAPVLIVLRIVQGLGGAAVMACGLGLIAQAFPQGPRRARATSIWAIALGTGVAIGPIIAAFAERLSDWHAAYVIEGILALALAFAGRAVLKESKANQPRPIDVGGTVTLGAGMAALLTGLTILRSSGLSAALVALFVAAIAFLLAFIWIEHRQERPMLDLSLFRRPDFTGATLGAFFSGCGVLALMSLTPSMLQRLYDVPPVTGAFYLLAWSATSAITPFVANRILASASAQAMMIGGLVVCAIGQLMTGLLAADTAMIRILIGMMIAGAANGLLNVALGQQAIASVPHDRSAMGSGANNSARYLGSAVGLTIAALLMAGSGGDSWISRSAAWDAAVIATAGLSCLGAFLIFLLPRSPKSDDRTHD